MRTIQINTTQNVNIDFNIAGTGERILASIIDFVIMFVYMFLVVKIAKAFGLGSIDDDWSVRAIYGILMLPVMLYTLISEIFFAGQTLGKKVLKIRVIKIDGYRASFADYFVRWLFRIIDIWIVTFPLIALISSSVSKKGQRIGGMASGTTVISLKNKVNISHTLLENVTETYKPTYPSVINLTDRDAQIIKNLFVRAKKERDIKMLIKLREKVEKVAKIAPQKDISAAAFLTVVLKDYTYYTQDMN